jgi:hypothetical protein
MRCEFTVPFDVDVAEASAPNQRLEAVRRALESDPRWSRHRVASVLQPDPTDGWHIDVWTIPPSNSTRDLARTCEGVCQTVSSVVPGAVILACEQRAIP